MKDLLIDYYFLKSFYCMGREYDKCFNCSYCRARNKHNNKEYFTPPSKINPLLITIPVVINVFYGDPLLYIDDTLRCLELLEQEKHRGPIIIITKESIEDARKVFNKKWDLKIHFGLSFFGNEKYDNYATFEKLKTNLKVCEELNKNYGYTCGIEYRPIIKNINDSEEIIKNLFNLAHQYSTTIAYSGLQVEKELAEYIKENNLPFEPYDGYEFGMKKNIGSNILDLIRTYSNNTKVPIFKKTSCAISYSQSLGRDYNAHYYRPNEMNCKYCFNYSACKLFKERLDKDEIDYNLIRRLPFNLQVVKKEKHECRLHRVGLCKFPSDDCMNIKGNLLQTDRKITTSDVRLIKWLTGFTVDAIFEESPYISRDWLFEEPANIP